VTTSPRRLRVLIVEDSEDDAELLLIEIRRAGYEPEYRLVQTRDDMSAALDQQGWDVILSDYNMPHFSALGALGLLHDRNLDIPFLILSGAIGEETAVGHEGGRARLRYEGQPGAAAAGHRARAARGGRARCPAPGRTSPG